MKKQIGIIGLGKMGFLMAQNLKSKRYKVFAYNRSIEPVKQISKKGIFGTNDLSEFVAQMSRPRSIILMVSAGPAIDAVLKDLTPLLTRGDTIIDGGNSHYLDSIKRYKKLKKNKINFLDMGTSGGLSGARNGASLMIGGDKKVYSKHKKLFKCLATRNGYGYMGESGAGHFVKTIHNGIEYSILEAYGEGYGILDKSKYPFDYREVSRVWNNGSVIRSWITELAENAFRKYKNKLEPFKGKIGGGQTGKWAVEIGKDLKCEVHTLEHAIAKRKKSLRAQSFSTRFVAAIRKEFGGHDEP